MTARYWSVRTDGLVTYSAVTDADVILLGQTQQVISAQEAIRTCLMQVRGQEGIDLYHDRTCKISWGICREEQMECSFAIQTE